MKPDKDNHIITTDVAVIGGGISGLQCARLLKLANKKVIVCEAQEEVGGRIKSLRIEGSNYEYPLGPEWITKRQRRIYNLLNHYKIPTLHTPHKGNDLFYFLGKRKEGKGKTPPFPLHVLIDLFLFQRKLHKLVKLVDPVHPWLSHNAQEFEEQTISTFLKNELHTNLGRALLSEIYRESICQELHEVSLLDGLWCVSTMGSYENFERAEDGVITGGPKSLIRAMAAELKKDIIVNCPVTSIEQRGNHVIVYSNDNIIKASRVIIAMPPALAASIKYDPPLSGGKAQLMQRYGQSSSVKVGIIYEKPFWRERGLSGWVYTDYGMLRGFMDSSYQSTDEVPFGVLSCFINGAHQRKWVDMGEQERTKAIKDQLVTLFGEEGGNFIQIITKDWTEDPWIRGGYAGHCAPGVILEFGKHLYEPCGMIHWAGTETSTQWRLYMEGALQSAERAVDEVLHKL